MLSFIAALAFVEVGAGVVMSEAWRQSHGAAGGVNVVELDQMLQRLRVVETTVAIGAVATTMLWGFLAINNTARTSRNRRTVVFAMAAWALAPVATVVLLKLDDTSREWPVRVGLVALQAVVLYVPFAAIGAAASRVGARRSPFLSWYLSVFAAFVVHHVFIGSTRLADTLPSDDLGRATTMSLLNGVVVGVIVVMAADASRSLEHATTDRAFLLNHARNGALARFGTGPAAPPRPLTWSDLFSHES